MLYTLQKWKQVFKLSLNCIVNQNKFKTKYDNDIVFITNELKKDLYFVKRVRNTITGILSLYADQLEHISPLDIYRCHISSMYLQTIAESIFRISK